MGAAEAGFKVIVAGAAVKLSSLSAWQLASGRSLVAALVLALAIIPVFLIPLVTTPGAQLEKVRLLEERATRTWARETSQGGAPSMAPACGSARS